MSIMAGVMARNASVDLDKWARDLAPLLSDHAGDKPRMHKGERYVFAKVDIGAFGVEAFRTDSAGGATMLTGEPLIERGDDEAGSDRARDLDILHDALRRLDEGPLKASAGIHCVAAFDPAAGILHLAGDKGGIRPLYYWHDKDAVVFATKLSVLERLPGIPKRMDIRGVTETAGFGFNLGNRTPYQGIYAIRPGEWLRFNESREIRASYWRWDKLELRPRPEAEQLKDIYAKFHRAVVRLNHRDPSTLSFLSGGLDSRCIVAVLRDLGVNVHTFNFAPEGTLDYILGAEFSKKSGTMHASEPMRPGTDFELAYRLRNWLDTKPLGDPQPTRRSVVWAGTGTASTLGIHRVTDGMAASLKKGDRRAAVREFLQTYHYTIPPRIFRSGVHDRLEKMLEDGVMEELEAIDSGDLAHDFRIFLILTYEKHHSDRIYEEVDRHRLELISPFLDWDFVESVFAVPVEKSIKRRLYNRLLRVFPPVTTQVAWQTYPGHDPCPLPLPPDIPDQWSRGNPYSVPNKEKTLALGREILSGPFPKDVLSRPFLTAALLMHRFGVKDYGYALKSAGPFAKYWRTEAAAGKGGRP